MKLDKFISCFLMFPMIDFLWSLSKCLWTVLRLLKQHTKEVLILEWVGGYLFVKYLIFFFHLVPKSSSTPAEDPLKLDECRLAGKYLLDLIKMDIKPRDIITPKSLRNAMAIVMALGGSTNAVLHLIAIARCVPWLFLDTSTLYSMKWLMIGSWQVCWLSINSWWLSKGQRQGSTIGRS